MSEGTPTSDGVATDEVTTMVVPTEQQGAETLAASATSVTPEDDATTVVALPEQGAEPSAVSAEDATTVVALPERAESANTGNEFAPPAEVPPPTSAPVPLTAPAPVPMPTPDPSAAAPQGWATPAGVGAPAQPQPQPPLAAGVPQPQPFPYPAPSPAPYPYLAAEQPPKPKRHFPWRWVGAVVVTLAVGAGCAFAVMAPKRTDLPGLATAADGRYTFAPLSLPTLAPGQADPTASANAGGQHVADIRKLLLPAPEGAVADHSLPGATGWVSFADTVTLLGGTSQSKKQLGTDGWRHTAGVAWKTPDGADTKIYLVQFIDSQADSDASSALDLFGGAGGSSQTFNGPGTSTVTYTKMVSGSTITWYGEVQVLDTELLIEFTAPNTVGIAPFEQETDLQVELLR